MFRIRISQLPVCDAHVSVFQLNSGIRDHVFMCMFRIHISQLPVCDARVSVSQNCLCAMAMIVLVRDKGSCVYVHVLYTYISTQLLVCDGHDGPGPG